MSGAPRPPAAERARAIATDRFGLDGGVLTVGGVRVTELAERHGTPLFAYDAGVLRATYETLRASLPGRVEIYYSIKANPNPEFVAVLAERCAGLEVASAAEFVRARAAGCPPERILMAGPGKSAEELAFVVEGDIGEIHLESEEEIERLGALERPVRVAIRFNPGAEAGGGAMRMGGQPAQFGFDEERLDEVVDRVEAHPTLELDGLHMFAGTQILDAAVLVGQWRHAAAVAARVADRLGRPLGGVDLGGGLGIPYFPNEGALDLDALRREAAGLFDEVERDARLAGTRFVLEPGRYLAGPCGVYLARVLSAKRSRGRLFVVLDGGMHHHLAASGNLGQVIKRDYPQINASRAAAAADTEATVVGPLCTPLDTLGRKAMLAEPRSGDLVAVFQSGAYGLSASPVGFLSHPMPAEVLVEGGVARVIRPRGTFEQPFVPLP